MEIVATIIFASVIWLLSYLSERGKSRTKQVASPLAPYRKAPQRRQQAVGRPATPFLTADLPAPVPASVPDVPRPVSSRLNTTSERSEFSGRPVPAPRNATSAAAHYARWRRAFVDSVIFSGPVSKS